jgi:hypothetical protein
MDLRMDLIPTATTSTTTSTNGTANSSANGISGARGSEDSGVVITVGVPSKEQGQQREQQQQELGCYVDNSDGDDDSDDSEALATAHKTRELNSSSLPSSSSSSSTTTSAHYTPTTPTTTSSSVLPGLRYLATDSWAALPRVSSLSLEGLGLGDEDAQLLACVLRRNTDLLTLSLRRNKIGAAGERALAAVFRVPTTTGHHHHSSGDGGSRSSSCGSDNQTLAFLDLRDNPRPAAGVAISQAVLGAGNTSLATLNGIPVLGMKTGAMPQVDGHKKRTRTRTLTSNLDSHTHLFFSLLLNHLLTSYFFFSFLFL